VFDPTAALWPDTIDAGEVQARVSNAIDTLRAEGLFKIDERADRYEFAVEPP
jgi:hypothetical protein